MARRDAPRRWYLFVAVAIAALLWAVVRGQNPIERPVDLRVEFLNVPESLVIVGQSTDVVNVRVRGSPAALRNIDASAVYAVDVAGAQSGPGRYEIDDSHIAAILPRGAQIVSRSPSRLDVTFVSRGTKVMQVRPDLAGEPSEGFRVASVVVDPPRVRVTGARREVLRLNEAVTEAIDITGLRESAEREVRLNLGRQNVWVEDPETVRVRVEIQAVEEERG